MPHHSYLLELPSPSRFRPSPFPSTALRLHRATPAHAPRCAALWNEVGRGFWTDRNPWNPRDWSAHLARRDVEFWIATSDRTDAGFFELTAETASVKIEGFGLLPPFRGCRLGAGLLSAATRRAFDRGVKRVWLHTATDDHPHALPNYLARGYQIFHDQPLPDPMPSDPLVAYYARRADEYERIYQKPERQADLDTLRSRLRAFFADRDVLEVACGTGYWTDVLATAARSIVATDINDEVLALARQKPHAASRAEFLQADSYALPAFPRAFDAAFAGFWWSHIPQRRLHEFLQNLHARLQPGARVMFVDNRYVPGSSTPISRTDTHGDTFQTRPLADGTTHEVLKNFPTPDQLNAAVAPFAISSAVELLDHFWLLTYRLP